VVDRDGMAVALTYTLEGGFGSHVVARGTGILLNNEMGDFNKKPGHTSVSGDIGTDANNIEPGKRMLSSMTPTMLINALEYDMDARAAVDAPRLHHQWLPDSVTFEDRAIPDSTVARLQAMGHSVRLRSRQGDAHTIRYDARARTAYGANDSRSADSKVSVP
jgi:gamma-glutamyltranspeptidase/glutathione hydrolase